MHTDGDCDTKTHKLGSNLVLLLILVGFEVGSHDHLPWVLVLGEKFVKFITGGSSKFLGPLFVHGLNMMDLQRLQLGQGSLDNHSGQHWVDRVKSG